MAPQERSATDLIREAREQHLARGVSMPSLVVERARGALIWDVDGREYIDFAGGLGPMLGVALPEPSPDRGAAVVPAAREEGLILLTYGLYGNVVRIPVPLAVTEPQLERGLAILEGALGG